MFLSELSSPQQGAFFELAVSLAAADGRLEDSERDALAQLARSAGQPLPDEPFAAVTPAEVLAVFTEPQVRNAVLLELLGLAYADTTFCDVERAFIDEIATAFGISCARLGVMEGWVVRQLALAAEGQRLLEDC
ncbi:MAG: tellurite resistance protein [Myxococcota bacterium]|jgi:tellurite resistance protein